MSNTIPTDIEKESLEAHVELCAQRYDAMKDKMEGMEKRLNNVENLLAQIKDILAQKEQLAYRKILSIGYGILGSLVTLLLSVAVYILKNPSSTGTH